MSPWAEKGALRVMVDENLVVMDGQGPFHFGRLLGPIRLLPADKVGALAIEGEMEVNEAGRRVAVRIPIAVDDAMNLWKLLTVFSEQHR